MNTNKTTKQADTQKQGCWHCGDPATTKTAIAGDMRPVCRTCLTAHARDVI